jgi:hypothetical protein
MDAIRTGSAPSVAVMTAALVANVHVYVIGDYYDVPTLKALALAKLQARVKPHWPADTLVHIVQLVTRMPPLPDDALYRLVRGEAVKHAGRLVQHAGFRALLAAGGPFAAEFFEGLVEQNADEVAGAWRVAQMAKDERLRAEEEAKLLRRRPGVRQLRAILDRHDECRHCSAGFGCAVDATRPIIRCSSCGTRHTMD